jgi:hypothetical protein
MLSKIDNTKHMTLPHLKTRLIKIWDEIPQQLVHAACISFEKRCQAVVKEEGEQVL